MERLYGCTPFATAGMYSMDLPPGDSPALQKAEEEAKPRYQAPKTSIARIIDLPSTRDANQSRVLMQ